MRFQHSIWAFAGLAWQGLCDTAATCPTTVKGSAPAPLVAPGFASQLIATGITRPRGIIFDSAGHLLVVQQAHGVVALTLNDSGGPCVTVASNKVVISDTSLNHGIELSPDNKILYVSNAESVMQYSYNAATASISGSALVLVNNMTNTDHVTRTLLLSKKQPGTLIVSRGSASNLDPLAQDVTTGHAQVKSFTVVPAPSKPYNFPTTGRLLAWGVRNDVGVAEHPVTGGIWTVENSVDNVVRQGVDIHNDNPAEELNYLGTLANTSSTGHNFGYPNCVSAWNVSAVPNDPGLKRGQQYSFQSVTVQTDAFCRSTVPPRLTFAAHAAPLDIKFNADGSAAYVTFHGSYDRAIPKGYQVSRVAFKNGEPVEPANSAHGGVAVVRNTGFNTCTTSTCFRPVGLAAYTNGRWIFSSDDTNELYIIVEGSSTATRTNGDNSHVARRRRSGI